MSAAGDQSSFPWDDESAKDSNRDRLEMIKEHLLGVARASEGLHGPDQAKWLEWLDQENEQTEFILTLCLNHPQYSKYALQLGVALWRFWQRRGEYEKGHDKLVRILEHGEGQKASILRAWCLEGQGALAKEMALWNEAEACYQQMLELGHSLNYQSIIASAWLGLADIQTRDGHFEVASKYLSDSYQIFQGLNDPRGTIKALKGMGLVATRQNFYELAIEHLEESLTIARGTENAHLVADCLIDLGLTIEAIAKAKEDYDLAERYYEEALTISVNLQDRARQASLLNNLCSLCHRLIDFENGLQYALKSRELYRGLGDLQHEAYTLMNAAECEMELESYSAAQEHLKESLHTLTSLTDKSDWFAIANILEIAGFLASRTEKPADAATFFGIAAALRTSIKSEIPPSQREKVETNLQALRAKLGKEAFDDKLQYGRWMPQQDIIRYTLRKLTL